MLSRKSDSVVNDGNRCSIAMLLRLHDKPVVLLDPDGHYAGLLDWLHGLVARGFLRDLALARLTVTADIGAALDACARVTTY